MKRLILIDAHAIIHRAFHALPRLTAPDGRLVNVVYGFASILLKMLRELKPDYAAAAFDVAQPTIRHIAFEAYKAQRVKAPDELYAQIPLVREILGAFGIPILEQAGYEADDIIGTISKRVEREHPETEIIIVTGDLDTLQLVSKKTKVFTMRKGITDTVLYDQKAVKERYGLKPSQLSDLRGLRGDPSDNIPGVKGIGEKTAEELLKRFGSIQALYQRLKDGKRKLKLTPALVGKLEAGEEAAKLSQALATINRGLPIPIELPAMRFSPQAVHAGIQRLFTELGFQSLLARLPEALGRRAGDGLASPAEPRASAPRSAPLLQNVQAFSAVPHGNRDLVMLAADADALYLVSDAARVYRLPLRPARLRGAERWVGDARDLYAYDLKALLRRGLHPFAGVAKDLLLFWYLLAPGRRGYAAGDLVEREFRLPDEPEPPEVAILLWELGPKLEERLASQGLGRVYQELESPLLPILAGMEEVGIGFDPAPLRALSPTLAEAIGDLESKIHTLAGGSFNINSPSQVSRVLFQTLGLSGRGLRKTKKAGALSTRMAELSKLRNLHPIVPLIREYREYAKLKSSFVDPLPRAVGPDGRIRTTWNQTGTATGRLASENPNLQNIPVRGRFAREIRSAFLAAPGFQLASFDYSQLELRIAANLARDEKMIGAFREGLDIHRLTAAEVNNIPVDQVTPVERHQAKALNFGILYGMGPRAFAESAGISREEAEFFIEEYFRDFAGIHRFIEETKALARQQGFTETPFGRKRSFPDIVGTGFRRQREAERMAVNFPVQGAEADIVKKAMIEVDGWIQGRGFTDGVRMLLQIHDELVFEIREGILDAAIPEIQKIMERVWPEAAVPMKVEVRHGSNWGELE